MSEKRADRRGVKELAAPPVEAGGHGHNAGRNVGGVRWMVCLMLFGATTICLLNRQVFGILASDLQHRFNWNEAEYGYIVGAFQFSYAIGLVAVGRLIDRLGTRLGYALIIGLWSLVTVAHGLVHTVVAFFLIRLLLGLTEAGNFPASIKGAAEWFPASERSLVAGMINAGTNMGVIAAALLVPWLSVRYGWQSPFVATGILGLMWSVWWWKSYRLPAEHPRLSRAEAAWIADEKEGALSYPSGEPKIPWIRLLGYKQLWAFTIAKGLVDPVWFFYLSWLPKLLYKQYHLSPTGLSLPLVIVFVASDVGSVLGGWLPSLFMRWGKPLATARRMAMVPCALAALPMLFGSHLNSLWLTVSLLGLAVAAQQGWSSNVYAIASDWFPRSAVASVVGFGSMVGSLGATLMAVITGWVLQLTGSYTPIFIYCALAYSVAFVVLQGMVPDYARIKLPSALAQPEAAQQ